MDNTNFDNKELLFNSLKSINLIKHDIKISRSPDYALIMQGNTLKPITVISIIGGNFTATISSKDHCSFHLFDLESVFESKRYDIDYKGLFKEVYGVIKPLLIIEDFDE